MKTAQSRALLSVVSIGALLLAGCTSSGGGETVEELTPITVVVGSPVPGLYSSDLYVADVAGFFEEEGLDVSIQHSQNTSTATQTVGSGQAEIGSITYEGLIMSYGQGLPGKFIYQSFSNNLYFVAVPDESEIEDASELEGLKVGVPGLGSGAVGVLGIMLEDAGLSLDSVTLVPVDAGSATTALFNGQIDALAHLSGAFAPYPGLTLRKLPNPEAAQVGQLGYFSSEAAISEKGDLLTRFLRAIAKATAFIQTNPEATVDIYFQVNPDGAAMGKDAALGLLTNVYVPLWHKEKPFGAFSPGLGDYIQAFGSAIDLTPLPAADDLTDSQFLDAVNEFDVDAITAAAKDFTLE